MTLPILTCIRCSHKWVPRKDIPPKSCPNCRSPYWNKERVRKVDDYRLKIKDIKGSYLVGEIGYDEARDQVEELLVEMNKIGAKIAKKHGRKYNKLTFGYVFR